MIDMKHRGYTVIFDDYIQPSRSEQKRKCQYKSWMKGRAYQRRINKKWLKRFGLIEAPCFIFTNGNLYTHPDNKKLLESV